MPVKPAALIRQFAPVIVCLGWVAAPGAIGTTAAADFYQDKTISIMVSGSGTYEAYARMLAKTMPKYIPRKPNIVVKQMIGAGGLKVANYIYNVAPKDGTEIGASHSHIPTITFFQADGAQYDPTKLAWIGSVSQEIYMGYVWRTSPAQSFAEAQVKQAVVGGGAPGTASFDVPVLANALAGAKFKIVAGYNTTTDIQLAVERGELDGHFGTTWSQIASTRGYWLKDNLIKVIAQFGRERAPDLSDVPLLLDYVKNADDRRALEIFLSRQETGKPYFAPPGTPKDRVDVLRKAFDSSLKDPEFLYDANQAGLDVIAPMNGQAMETLIEQVYNSPKSYAARINDIFTGYRKAN